MCQGGPHHFGRHQMGHGCCCPPRRFLTKEEEIERLKRYATGLEKELAGLREYIQEMEKK